MNDDSMRKGWENRRNGMSKKAYGFPVRVVIEEELSRITDPREAKKRADTLHKYWKWQTVNGRDLYSVTSDDWGKVKSAFEAKFPGIKFPDYVTSEAIKHQNEYKTAPEGLF